MLSPWFILLPLYVYPDLDAWSPLLTAAKAYPDVTFAAVVNPANGPGAGSCPSTDYANAINNLNAYDNIKTIGYVHTATSYNCGSSGSDICTCSVPLNEIEANVTTYHGWANASCGLHVDGIFIDEGPSKGDCVEYMRTATSFVKEMLSQESAVIFNSGTSVNASYFDIADYVNVFENTEAAFEGTNSVDVVGDARYLEQSTLIIYDYSSGRRRLRKDVSTLLDPAGGGSVAGLYLSDRNVYSAFPSNWMGFVGAVNRVTQARKRR